MQIQFPDYVTKTLNILNAAGYEAYVVGGAVRDLLLGLEPGDYDIATDGRPEQIAAVLRNADYLLVEKLGENFGVVVAVTEGRSLEIATFRNERYAYGQDAHRPAEVWFCDTLKEDLSRRDFTVNAMAMDSRGKLYDYYGGQEDLQAKVLRTVGNPRKRFAEDALRMYRACRFVAQLDFTYVEGNDTAEDVLGDYSASLTVEQNLRIAMVKAGKTVPENLKTMGPDAQLTHGNAIPGSDGSSRDRLLQDDGAAAGLPFGQPGTKYYLKKRYVFDVSRCRNLSLERVKTELDKMLLGKAAGKGLALFLSSGLANAQCRVRDKGNETFVDVLPELAHLPALPQNIRFHCYNVWEHILAAVDNGPRELTLRWGLLLHDVAKGLPGVRGATPDGYPNDHGHEKESAKMAEAILVRLRYPRPFVRRVSWLVAKHMRFAPMMIHKNNTLLRWIRSEATGGEFRTEKEMAEAFSQLTDVFLADMGATWAGVLQEPVMEEGRRLGEEAVRIARERMPVHTSDLHVRGSEIKVLPPLTVGDAMKYLLARVQSGSIPNERGALLQALAKKLEKITKAE
ncbi:CCA tRNA nucleotidyltransferase [Succiniclasticum ruminis]|uniref:HD domain-containing protein n=1 Tax=Succiniclasticum ruminis DSM 9236 TaxID=1123323 RepID=A0A1I1XE56_9FIRM|nr:CCA tRNA nucleotidyltransferase [Succiniclasticum ruminis]SFE04938.1 HD domain-containing protein [Succiniclasticum ruminis DSM 9236]